jgi:hypothetical protein
MRASVLEIPSIKLEKQRKMRLDKGLREAVAEYLRRRFPSGTAKSAAREFDLTADRAREAVAGRASLTTIEAIIKRGGWSVALPILAEVIGQQIARHLIELRQHHEANAGRLAALTSDLWPVRGVGLDDPPGLGRESDERRVFAGRREGQG